MQFAGLNVGLVGPLAPPAGGMANQTQQLAELLRAGRASVTMVQTNSPYSPMWAGEIPGLRAIFRLVPFLLAVWRAAGKVAASNVVSLDGDNRRSTRGGAQEDRADPS